MNPIVRMFLILLTIGAPGLAWMPVCTAQAEETNQEDASRRNRAGIEHLEANRPREAIQAFQEALERLPDDQTIRKNLATAYARLGVNGLKRGQFAAAGRAFRQAAGLDPKNANLLYYRGVLAFKQGHYTESVDLLEKAIERKPENAAAWTTLGHAYYRLDRLDRTIAAWQAALARQAVESEALQRYLKQVRAETRLQDVALAGQSRHFRVKVDSTFSGLENTAADVLRFLEDGHDKVSADLGFYPRETITVVLYAKRNFQQVTGMQHWVGGTFDGARIRVAVKDYARHREAIRRTLVHEFTHMVVLRLAGGMPVPAWINEGIARVEEGVTSLEAHETLKRMGGKRGLFAFSRLEQPFASLNSVSDARLAYAQSCAFTHYLVSIHTMRGVGRFIRALRDPPAGGMPATFQKTFGVTLEDAIGKWKETLGD